ncbi:MAG: Ig-like domain-containing protein [Cyclobacteriaceae bacterium]
MIKFIFNLKSIAGITLSISLLLLSGCGSDKNGSDTPEPDDGFALFIDGPIALQPGNTASYTAVLMSVLNGEVDANVEWSESTLAGDGPVVSINSNGNLEALRFGVAKITATVEAGDGLTYTASLPVSVTLPGTFVVTPAAIIASVNESPIQLETVYMGPSVKDLNITYESGDAQVATVSNTGLVSFVGAGEAVITVQAGGIEGSPLQEVPILVIQEVDVPLPVARVDIQPGNTTLFPGETQLFEASVFNGEGNRVTDKSVSWKLVFETDEDGLEIEAGSISTSGLFEAMSYGKVQVVATVEGVSDIASVFVIPENVIISDPLSTGIPAGSTKQFSAVVYPMNRETLSVSPDPLEEQPKIEWVMLDFGIPQFSIGTVDEQGLVTINEDVLPGALGFLMASSKDDQINAYPGFSTINVGIASDCDCGVTDPAAVAVSVEPVEVNISLSSGILNQQLTARVVDAGNLTVGGASISYCSDNETVAAVDETGEIIGLAVGTATITVCHGTLEEQVTVNVSF